MPNLNLLCFNVFWCCLYLFTIVMRRFITVNSYKQHQKKDLRSPDITNTKWLEDLVDFVWTAAHTQEEDCCYDNVVSPVKILQSLNLLISITKSKNLACTINTFGVSVRYIRTCYLSRAQELERQRWALFLAPELELRLKIRSSSSV